MKDIDTYFLTYIRLNPIYNDVKIIILKMMGNSRNFCLSRDVLEISFITAERGILVVRVVVAVWGWGV